MDPNILQKLQKLLVMSQRGTENEREGSMSLTNNKLTKAGYSQHRQENSMGTTNVIQTVVYRQYVNGEPKVRVRVVAGDKRDEINRGPSYSYNGREYYMLARLVTPAMRKSEWYKSTQFDSEGNSDRL